MSKLTYRLRHKDRVGIRGRGEFVGRGFLAKEAACAKALRQEVPVFRDLQVIRFSQRGSKWEAERKTAVRVLLGAHSTGGSVWTSGSR